MATIAVVALMYARREYKLKNRPFLSCELRFEQKDDTLFLFVVFKNSGNCPASINFKDIVLKIGDDNFPTRIQNEQYLPVLGLLDLSVGHINKVGIEKYKARQYKMNRIEVLVCAKYDSVYDKRTGSEMVAEFEVDFLENHIYSRLLRFSQKKA